MKTFTSMLLTALSALLLLLVALTLWSVFDPAFRDRLVGWLDREVVSPWSEQLPSVHQRQARLEQLQREAVDRAEQAKDLREDLAVCRQSLAGCRQEAGQNASALEAVRARVAEEKRHLDKEFEALSARLREADQSRDVAIERLRNDLAVIRVGARVLFDSGSAVLKPSGKQVLKLIAATLNQFPQRPVRVDGHTDDRPIVTPAVKARFPSNWDLSAGRAVAAARFLEEQGVAPTRLMPTGLGEFHPVADNDTPEGRARNRRIEIVLMPPEERLPTRELSGETG